MDRKIESILDGSAGINQRTGVNFGSVTGVSVTFVVARALRGDVSDELLAFIQDGFYATPQFDRALAHLSGGDPIVALTGSAGSGRKVTALALLATLKTEKAAKCSYLPYESLADLVTAGETAIERDSAFLLVMPESEGEAPVSADLGALLWKFLPMLRKTSSRLVIVAETLQWKRFEAATPANVVRVEPPLSSKIAASWLRVQCPYAPVQQWMDNPAIKQLLQNREPRVAMRVLGLIVQAIDSARMRVEHDARFPSTAGDDVDELAKNVVDGFNDWTLHLMAWHAEPGRTSLERNYLLASASLQTLPSAVAYAGAILLASEFGEPVADHAGQRAPGVLELARKVDAHITSDLGVHFLLPGWSEAVVKYFWHDRPMCHSAYLKWVVRLPLDVPEALAKMSVPVATSALQARTQSLTIDWASRNPNSTHVRLTLEALIEAWSDRGSLITPLTHAITDAAFDPTIDRPTHTALRHWAKHGSTNAKRVVAKVCAGRFGKAFPQKAMVRLKHIARSPDGELDNLLRIAVRELWYERSAALVVLREVAKWCRDADPAVRRGGTIAFSALAASESATVPDRPALLSDDHGTLRKVPVPWADMTAGWTAVLQTYRTPADETGSLHSWFDASLEYGPVKRATFRVVAEVVEDAVRCDPQAIHNLRDVIHQWYEGSGRGTGDERYALKHELDVDIDRLRREAV